MFLKTAAREMEAGTMTTPPLVQTLPVLPSTPNSPDDECFDAMPLCPLASFFFLRILVPHLFSYVLWGLERPMEYEFIIRYILRYWEWEDEM